MRSIHYPENWDPQDCILVADALVRYARWDCENESDRQQRAIELAHEVTAGEGLTLEDALRQVNNRD